MLLKESFGSVSSQISLEGLHSSRMLSKKIRDIENHSTDSDQRFSFRLCLDEVCICEHRTTQFLSFIFNPRKDIFRKGLDV